LVSLQCGQFHTGQTRGSLANTAVTVDGGASLGGTGTIAGSITVTAGTTPAERGAIDLVDGASSVLTLSNPSASATDLTLGGTVGNSSLLDMEVGATSDEILLTNGKLLVNPGGAQINIVPLTGFNAGVYDLFVFQPGQASGLANLTLTTTNIGGYTLSLQSTSTAEQLVVVPEPDLISLLVIGAAALTACRRRSR
jgi:fibronectin-binding autotransporter adhesin